MNSKKNKPDPAEVPLDTFRSQAEARLVEFVNSDLLDNLIDELSYLNTSLLAFFDKGFSAGEENQKNIILSQKSQCKEFVVQLKKWIEVQSLLKNKKINSIDACQSEHRLTSKTELGELTVSQFSNIDSASFLKFRGLTEDLVSLYDQIARLDRSLYGSIAAQKGNTVADQIERIRSAYI